MVSSFFITNKELLDVYHICELIGKVYTKALTTCKEATLSYKLNKIAT